MSDTNKSEPTVLPPEVRFRIVAMATGLRRDADIEAVVTECMKVLKDEQSQHDKALIAALRPDDKRLSTDRDSIKSQINGEYDSETESLIVSASVRNYNQALADLDTKAKRYLEGKGETS